jgi:DNA processing protein
MNLRALLALSFVPGVGNQRLRALLDHFGDPEDVFGASLSELKSVPAVDSRTAQEIKRYKPDTDGIETILRKLDRLNGRIISIKDSGYPTLLKQIYDPPALLYMLGSIEEKDHDSIALVGTRNPTEYGKEVTEELCGGLVQSGFTIVSGLARGIDTVVHSAALHFGGRTIAVIGCGVDIIYPQDNIRISRQIQQRGAILSEYHIGTKPEAGNFPKRNRIISGMTLGTVIIESSSSGGAMITASYALDQNREIFAVPGPITEKRSNGTNTLIQQGRAKLVQSCEDIIEEVVSKLKYITPSLSSVQKPESPVELNIFEEKIYGVLAAQPLHIDEIAHTSGLSTSDALVHLLSLEFKGVVRQLAGKMFSRR